MLAFRQRVAVVRLAAVLSSILCASTGTGTASASIDISPDISVELNGAVFDDDEVARDDFSMDPPTVANLGDIPSGADVVAYQEVPGAHLFSLDITAVLGTVTVIAGDVVRYDYEDSTYSLELELAALDIPAGVLVDALTLDVSGSLVVSFNTTVDLGSGLVADDEDLVAYDLATGFTSVFDGSAAGVDPGLDLDAASWTAGARYLLSFDGSGSLGGVAFDDEDVLQYDAVRDRWSLMYDGSVEHATLAAADVVAVPEPSSTTLSLAALVLLALSCICRREVLRCSRPAVC